MAMPQDKGKLVSALYRNAQAADKNFQDLLVEAFGENRAVEYRYNVDLRESWTLGIWAAYAWKIAADLGYLKYAA